jgi:hypothetical protein
MTVTRPSPEKAFCLLWQGAAMVCSPEEVTEKARY